MDAAIETFLQGLGPYWRHDEARQRVVCLVTGHEMPASNLGLITLHFQGRRFNRLKQNLGVDFAQFEAQHIVPDRNSASKLYCKVTKQSLNRLADEVRKHISGRRYQAALPAYEAGLDAEDEEDEVELQGGWVSDNGGDMDVENDDDDDDDEEVDEEDGEDDDEGEAYDDGEDVPKPARFVENIDGTPVFRVATEHIGGEGKRKRGK